jgi:curli biogenesis system outer membrane secretion channel CsgG
MDESASILIAVVVGVFLIAALMFLYIPEPSNSVLVADTRFDVAILEFRNSSTWFGIEETVRSRAEAKLVNTSAIDVFSRAQLDALLIERALDASGLIDAATAVEIGSLAGVSKLITGSVYAVDTRSDETTVCTEWTGGQCVTRVPGIEYSARVLVQIEVIDVETGLIERVFDLEGSESVSLPAESTFGGFDMLLANAASEIADEVSRTLTSYYFRDLRYGLYSEVEEKRGGFVGRGKTDRFSVSDGTAYLIVHFTQMESRELFDVDWVTSSGETIQRDEDLVGEGNWRLYSLALAGLAPGRYFVRATLSGTLAFQQPFTVSP